MMRMAFLLDSAESSRQVWNRALCENLHAACLLKDQAHCVLHMTLQA